MTIGPTAPHGTLDTRAASSTSMLTRGMSRMRGPGPSPLSNEVAVSGPSAVTGTAIDAGTPTITRAAEGHQTFATFPGIDKARVLISGRHATSMSPEHERFLTKFVEAVSERGRSIGEHIHRPTRGSVSKTVDVEVDGFPGRLTVTLDAADTIVAVETIGTTHELHVRYDEQRGSEAWVNASNAPRRLSERLECLDVALERRSPTLGQFLAFRQSVPTLAATLRCLALNDAAAMRATEALMAPQVVSAASLHAVLRPSHLERSFPHPLTFTAAACRWQSATVLTRLLDRVFAARPDDMENARAAIVAMWKLAAPAPGATWPISAFVDGARGEPDSPELAAALQEWRGALGLPSGREDPMARLFHVLERRRSGADACWTVADVLGTSAGDLRRYGLSGPDAEAMDRPGGVRTWLMGWEATRRAQATAVVPR